jgi:hypothetical protein
MSANTIVPQICVFIENRPGRAATVCGLLEENGVNVRGFMISDTNDYGVLRLVVDRPDEALAVLEGAGYAAKTKPVLVARLADEPGCLHGLLAHLAQADVDVVYAYSLISTYVAIAVRDADVAAAQVAAAGVELVTLADLAAEVA